MHIMNNTIFLPKIEESASSCHQCQLALSSFTINSTSELSHHLSMIQKHSLNALTKSQALTSIGSSTSAPPCTDPGISLRMKASASSGRLSWVIFKGSTAFIWPSENLRVPDSGVRSAETGVLSVEFLVIFHITETAPWVPPFLTMMMPSYLKQRNTN